MRRLVLLLLGMMVWSLVSCADSNADHNMVYVDGGYPGADAVSSRILNQLRPDDRISVQVLTGTYSMPIEPGTTNVTTVASTKDIIVAANDGWLDQVTAEELLMRAKNITQDRIDTVIVFIRSVHTWQDQHPRPVPPPPPAAPINWTPWLIAGAIALVVGLFIWLVLRRHRRYQNLARRADEQQRAYDSGDLSWVADFKKE